MYPLAELCGLGSRTVVGSFSVAMQGKNNRCQSMVCKNRRISLAAPRASRRPHTSRISIATTPLLDPIPPVRIQFCIAILNIFKLIGYPKAL